MDEKNIVYLGITGCQAIIDKIKGIEASIETAYKTADAKLKSDLEAIIEQLDTDLSSEIDALEDGIGELESKIKGLNSDGKDTGAVVTNVTQSEGQIEVTAADLKSTDKTVTINGLNLGVNVDNKTIKAGDDGKLYVDESATAVSGENAIVVTDSNGKKVTLKIKDGDKLLAQDENGLSSTVNLVKETENLSENVREQYKLIGVGGTQIGETIVVYKDSSLKEVTFSGQKLHFTYILANGSENTVDIDVSSFLSEEEFKDGLTVVDHVVKVKIDEASEKFLSVSEDGIKLSGVQTAIDTAKAAVVGGASDGYDTLGKIESKVKDLEGVTHIEITAKDIDDMFKGTYGD